MNESNVPHAALGDLSHAWPIQVITDSSGARELTALDATTTLFEGVCRMKM